MRPTARMVDVPRLVRWHEARMNLGMSQPYTGLSLTDSSLAPLVMLWSRILLATKLIQTP